MLTRLLPKRSLSDESSRWFRLVTAARKFASGWSSQSRTAPPATSATNPLQEYFDSHAQGRGIWKWRHYFEVYHRHLAKFVGKSPNVLEIGVYSGGSIEMWQTYFGAGSTIHGVDIEPACRSYESENVRIHIGDQADRDFWKRFRAQVPRLDVIIDDGGHTQQQQIVTLEELLPHLAPGGVYVCEDIHGVENGFLHYLNGLCNSLSAFDPIENESDAERRITSRATPFQAAVHSVHVYPLMCVIERTDVPVSELVAPKHGTHWQPFLH